MCDRCDYRQMLATTGLSSTSHRLRVLEVVGNNTSPLNAQEIYETMRRTEPINRVTVYRILDSLVEKGLVQRISGGRASFFGLAPNIHHQHHPHFYCRGCGQIDCLTPKSVATDISALERIFPGQIDNVEVRVDGLCKNCLRSG